MNLYEKLLAITSEISSVAKNLDVNVGKSSYKATGEADVLKAVKELEAKYKVYSYPSDRMLVKDEILTQEKEYNGQVTRSSQVFMRIRVEYTFVNVEKPEETISVISYGDGVDTQDKAPGKAMTYADKYALMKAYKIITGDDPDQKGSEEMDLIGEKIISSTKVTSLQNLAKDVDVDACKEVLSKYGYNKSNEIKNKDYNAIRKEIEALKK